MSGERACRNCEFVKTYPHFSNMLCRRYPPIGAGRMTMAAPFYEGEFPRVDKDDWCGEFKPAPPPPEAAEALEARELANPTPTTKGDRAG